MQLPFLKTKDKQKNFFLSLLIKSDRVGAILFEEINSKLFILSTNETEVEDTSTLSEEELLSAADKVISFVEAKLPEGSEVEKTIFSVPYYWVEEGLPAGRQGKIRHEHLEKLKRVCKDLGLVPVGYIVSIEAIVSFLQKSDGAPVSGIFIEITQSKIFLYIVRASKIIEEKQTDIEENIIKTCEKLLQEVESVDVLPSKIVLLDYKDGSSIQQEFLSHAWSKNIAFLHLPQVMMLEKGFENEAIINGVATQMELEVLHDVTAPKTQSAQDVILEEADHDFGFTKEGAAASAKSSGEPKEDGEEKEESEPSEKPEPTKEKSTGDEPNISYFKEGSEENQEKPPEDTSTQTLPARLAATRAQLKMNLPDISMIFSMLKNLKIPKVGKIPFSESFSGPLKIKAGLALIGVILLAFFLSFVYYNFILSAKITITSDKRSVDKTQNVFFSGDSTEGTNIAITIIEETIDGEENKNATGKKETGEYAKGDVTLYNKTDQRKVFAKGTSIIGPNDLEFELTEEVTIASTSPFSTSLTSAKGKVTASNFGKEYNLASNTNFTIQGFSSAQFIGKNTDSITGGTKTETTVVSEEDLEELLSQVSEKLEKEAISKAREKLASGEEILPSVLSSEFLERKYTKKEGEESGSVGISAKIKYAIGKYAKSDLDSVVESSSDPDIPATYVLRKGESKIAVTDVKIDEDQEASGVLKVSAVYAPQIESDKLVESLKGKDPDAAAAQIKSIEGVREVIITFNNKLPFMPLVLPRQGKNIFIKEEYSI